MPNINNSNDFESLFSEWKGEMDKRKSHNLSHLNSPFKAAFMYLFCRKRFVFYMLKINSGVATFLAMDDAWNMKIESINKYIKVRGWEF